MSASLAMLLMLAVAEPAPDMDGTRLSEGDACFAIQVHGKTVGTTRQTVQAKEADGHATWDITIHQQYNDGTFDMRDHFIVDRKTMRPLTMESERGKEPADKGWHRIRLIYQGNRVHGTRQTAAGTSPIDVSFDHPVWDANLWGLTFAALPLKDGASFVIPTWQYDTGRGQLTVKVVGRATVHTSRGDVPSWTLLAGDSPDHLVRYQIAVNPPAELGYAAGPFAQVPGEDCGSR